MDAVAPGASLYASRTLSANEHDVFGPAYTPSPQLLPLLYGLVTGATAPLPEPEPEPPFARALVRFAAARRCSVRDVVCAQEFSRSVPLTVCCCPAIVGPAAESALVRFDESVCSWLAPATVGWFSTAATVARYATSRSS